MKQWRQAFATLFALCVGIGFSKLAVADDHLIGYWPLRGDCRDHSGNELHGENHGVALDKGAFDGRSAYVEIPANAKLDLGARDFTFSAWVWTPEQLDDIGGDVLSMYDPRQRRGLHLTIDSSAGGYQAQGTDRHVQFGIDDAAIGEWEDCGHPNPTSNYVSNSLTVFDGHLYAATTDGAGSEQWSHVYRYDGDQRWIDCGRVGNGKTTGVMPLIVHDGQLYAATSTYDWTRVKAGDYEPGRVYRYLGGDKWEDCGQPSDDRTLNSLASYRGKLYAGGGPQTWGVFVSDGDGEWSPSQIFPMEGPKSCFPHAMCRHNGLLFTAFPGAFAFDGHEWKSVGDPLPLAENPMLQTHSMTIHRGRLVAGTWPHAKATEYQGNNSWKEFGRVGEDGTEVNALVVYNGKLYGGSLPRSEVCRYDGDDKWTSIKRFHSPPGWKPGFPGAASRDEVKEWGRVTSLTAFDGKLFASTGSCTSSIEDAPVDVRGKVFCMEAGKSASLDKDLGRGWKHLAAVRTRGVLRLYVDGKLVDESDQFDESAFDLTNGQPLQIGFGESDYFDGRIHDVRLHGSALDNASIEALAAAPPEQ
jgi:hypothetical protein